MQKEEAHTSDNAKNNRRGLRAKITNDLAAFIKSAYDMREEIKLVDLGGSSCLNAFFTAKGDHYIARVYRPYVSADRVRDMNAVRQTLIENDLPCPRILPNKGEALFQQFEGRIVEVEEFIAHDNAMDSLARIFCALPLLGKMHTVLKDVRVREEGAFPLFANFIAPNQVLEMTKEGCCRLGRWKSSAYHQKLITPSLKLAELASRSEMPVDLQLVHGDYWDSNVLFRGDTLVGILDFDFMGARTRIDDLALTLYFASMKYKNDYSFDEWLAILRQMVVRYDGGLRNPLTDREHAALPASIARQPLWSIGGWVAFLDDEALAYAHASDMLEPVEWALKLISSVDAL